MMKKYSLLFVLSLFSVLGTSCMSEISKTTMSVVFPDSVNQLKKGCSYRVDYNNTVGGLKVYWADPLKKSIRDAVCETMKEAGPDCVGLADVVILTDSTGGSVRVQGHPIYRQ